MKYSQRFVVSSSWHSFRDVPGQKCVRVAWWLKTWRIKLCVGLVNFDSSDPRWSAAVTSLLRTTGVPACPCQYDTPSEKSEIFSKTKMSPCYKHMRPLPTHNFVHNKQGHFCLIIFQMRMQQAWRFSKPEKWGFHSNSVQRSKVVIDHYKRWPGPLSTSRPQIIVKLASGYNAVQTWVLWSIHFSVPGFRSMLDWRLAVFFIGNSTQLLQFCSKSRLFCWNNSTIIYLFHFQK